jgi:predicted nucleic acid-binding protein
VTRVILDNSMWARTPGDAAVTELVLDLQRSPHDQIVTCPPQVLEFCHSARSLREYEELRSFMDSFEALTRKPEQWEILDLQRALWRAGLGRAAGASDLTIAAYAIANDATVFAADRDFVHIARASGGRLKHRYFAP